MADKWYFARDGKQQGPFSPGQLKNLATTGELQPLDAVWKEGTANSVAAGKVKYLFAEGPHNAAKPASKEALPEFCESPLPPVAETPTAPPEVAVTTPDAYILDLPDNPVLLSLDDNPWLAAAPPASEPAGKPPANKVPAEQEVKARAKRVTGIKGGNVVSQDGVAVRFRKKCLKCGHADTGEVCMPIRLGCTRVSYFCPKCKRNQPVEIQGV